MLASYAQIVRRSVAVTAVAGAGLRLDFLREREFTLFRRFPVLERFDGGYRFPAGHPRVPLLYSLRATAA